MAEPTRMWLRPSHWMCVAVGANLGFVLSQPAESRGIWTIVALSLGVLVLRLAGLVVEYERERDRTPPPPGA